MKVLSALHDSIPVRFGHLQEKIMRVGRTIYVADLRSFSSTVDTGVQLSRANQASHGDGYCIAASPPFRNRACFAALAGSALVFFGGWVLLALAETG